MRREVGGILFLLIGIILVLFITTDKGKAVLAVLAGKPVKQVTLNSQPSDVGITRGTIKS